MTSSWKAMLTAWVATIVIAGVPAMAGATCGDLNNDGVVNSADVSILAQCVGSACPTVSPGPLCGTGNLNDCGDVFNEGAPAFSAPNVTDLATLQDAVAGLGTLHDLCQPETAAVCPGSNISSGITTSTHWGPAPCTVTVDNTILIETPEGAPTTVLTIDPGVVIKGQAGTVNPSTLIVLPRARASLRGTETSPIVMTSTNAPGSRNAADHGGFMLNGRSTVNRPGCTNFSEGVPDAYGGCQVHDNSGIVTFFRSEFSGRVFTPNNELNSFTMNGIGDRTVINHVQALNGADDCIEWFGGTVNTDHMVCVATGDDGFDWQLGTSGNMQFGVAVFRQPNYSSGANGDNGFESDNSEFGFDDQPRSNPSLCNVTVVGDPSSPSAGNTDGAGWLMRRGTAGHVANSIVTGFLQGGLRLVDDATGSIACVNGTTLRSQNTCDGGGNAGNACSQASDCPGGLCEAPNLRAHRSVFYGNGGGPLCNGGGNAGNPCVTDTDCPSGVCDLSTRTSQAATSSTASCSTAQLYGMLRTTEGIEPANGTNDINPGLQLASNYFNLTCNPLSGNCPTAYNFKPTFSGPGTVPTPLDCRTLSDSAAGWFKPTTYIGAIDPTGATPDWVASGFAGGWLSFTYK